MKHNDVDYGISEDPADPRKWRYTIFPKLMRGGTPKTISVAGYGSYSEAAAACKEEIDFGISGASGAKRS